jgi:hypothetical protein
VFALQISEDGLAAMFRRAKPCFDNEVAAILAQVRRSRVIWSDETTVRIDSHSFIRNTSAVLGALRRRPNRLSCIRRPRTATANHLIISQTVDTKELV